MSRRLVIPLFLVACLSAAEERLVVHEWGVRIVGTANEYQLVANPQAVLGAPREMLADLPAFIGRHDLDYQPVRTQPTSWRKPVIHLYGPDGLAVMVEVRTPAGRPTAYWPLPRLLEEVTRPNEGMGTMLRDAVGMAWSGTLRNRVAAGALAAVPAGHWMQTARDIPGSYVETAGGTERFLFYEAVSRQQPTVAAMLQPDVLILVNRAVGADGVPVGSGSGPVIVIFNDAGERHFLVIPTLWSSSLDGKPRAPTRIGKEQLLAADGDEGRLLAACRAQWQGFGMSAVEAAGIVDIWKDDILHHPGFLVISRMVPDAYERMFPLAVTPRPDELVRVGLVFDTVLPTPQGDPRLAWLPKLAAAMKAWGDDLGSRDAGIRRAAVAGLGSAGDLALPLLATLRTSRDFEVRAAALALLEPLQPKAQAFTAATAPSRLPGPQGLMPSPRPSTMSENLDLRILPAPGPMKIDGDQADWDLSSGIFVCGDVAGQRDTDAVWFHAMWDADNLYVLARWQDPTPLGNPGVLGDNGFNGDCLQFRVLTAPADGLVAAATRMPGDMVRDLPGTRTSHFTAWRDRNGADSVQIDSGWHFDEGSGEGLKQGCRQAFTVWPDRRGYTQELAIPWALLGRDGWKPAADARIMMTVEANFLTAAGTRLSIKDLFRSGVRIDRMATFSSPNCWGFATLEAKGRLEPRPLRLADGRILPVRLVGGVPGIDWSAVPKVDPAPVPVPVERPVTVPPIVPSDF